jgi:undecaprenyl diphosphate synthase
MGLVLVGVSKYLRKLAADGVRIRIVGDRSGVSDKLRAAWDEAETLTANATPASTCRWPSTTAAAGTWCRPASKGRGRRPVGRADRRTGCPPHGAGLRARPRPVHPHRWRDAVSNFLLWQTAYAELYFSDCLWPDFGAHRDRRRARGLRAA